ncbi:hypothetical protein B0H10DRAFT_1957473 [Mycena sp. CBHHK59/15]|nr:hypothetical protein B0H10DRAFT_1957473 [Mycena sp. CBHHK59/15]
MGDDELAVARLFCAGKAGRVGMTAGTPYNGLNDPSETLTQHHVSLEAQRGGTTSRSRARTGASTWVKSCSIWHFIHHYQFNLWKGELRTPGGTQTAAERNKGIQARIRLHTSRMEYLKSAAVRLMFVVKATSDDESTTSGPRVLAREERPLGLNQPTTSYHVMA